MSRETIETLQMLGVIGVMLILAALFVAAGAPRRKEMRREEQYLAARQRGESVEQARATAESIVRRRR